MISLPCAGGIGEVGIDASRMARDSATRPSRRSSRSRRRWTAGSPSGKAMSQGNRRRSTSSARAGHRRNQLAVDPTALRICSPGLMARLRRDSIRGDALALAHDVGWKRLTGGDFGRRKQLAPSTRWTWEGPGRMEVAVERIADESILQASAVTLGVFASASSFSLARKMAFWRGPATNRRAPDCRR